MNLQTAAEDEFIAINIEKLLSEAENKNSKKLEKKFLEGYRFGIKEYKDYPWTKITTNLINFYKEINSNFSNELTKYYYVGMAIGVYFAGLEVFTKVGHRGSTEIRGNFERASDIMDRIFSKNVKDKRILKHHLKIRKMIKKKIEKMIKRNILNLNKSEIRYLIENSNKFS